MYCVMTFDDSIGNSTYRTVLQKDSYSGSYELPS